MITLKKAHFANKGIYLTPDAVSNGHWAIRKDALTNSALFVSEETANAAFPGLGVQPMSRGWTDIIGSGTTRWETTAYLWDDGRQVYRILKHAVGVSAIDTRYLALVGCNNAYSTLYSEATGEAPFRDAEAPQEATWVLMPVRVKDMPPFPQMEA